jgi:hypothetical protein
MTKPLRIGILIDPNRSLVDWETRLFVALFKDPRFEVVCTMKDARSEGQPAPSRFSRVLARIRSGSFIRSELIRLIEIAEKRQRRGLRPTFTPEDAELVRTRLAEIPCLRLLPERKNYVDKFSKEDCSEIYPLDLDVIIRRDFNIVRGALLAASRHGIWSFHHADNKINRGGPAGFWEIFLGEGITGSTLQVLEDELDGGKVIAKGFYNTRTHWAGNNEFIMEKSVELMTRELARLYETGTVRCEASGIYSKQLYRSPRLSVLLAYALRVPVKAIMYRVFRRLRMASTKRNVWKLHYGKRDVTKGGVLNAVLWRTKTIEPPAGEFWADPFLMERDGKTYLFFENYVFATERGKISVAELTKKGIGEVQDAIDTDYHFSYPFPIEHEGETYLIPDSSSMNRLEIWRCLEFPARWELYRTRFEGVSMADSNIVIDDSGQHWLFTSISYDKYADHCSHLYIFKIDSPLMDEIEPHKFNPVVTDSRFGRNAGDLFRDSDGRLIRCCQASQNGVYGECLNLVWVKKLSLTEYEEVLIDTITPDYKDGMIATHHLTQSGDQFVTDGCYPTR